MDINVLGPVEVRAEDQTVDVGSRLRARLGDAVIVTHAPGYRRP